MSFNLRNRSFLTLADFNTREMEYMLNLAEDLKKAKYIKFRCKTGSLSVFSILLHNYLILYSFFISLICS